MTITADVVPESRAIAVERLDLDPENPRLVVEGRPTQLRLLSQLYEEEALDEPVHSFLGNGYFAEEPLVVVRHDGRYTVAEGNRRLATIKLLLDPSLRKKVRVAGWPTPTALQARRLSPIPCVIYPTRNAVLPFLGFRHITGAKKWAPFQRARFVSQMLEAGRSLPEIEESLGDSSATVKKLYQEYVVFTQLVEDLDFPATQLRDRFSLLEVMLGERAIKQHIGLPHRLPAVAVDVLVDDDHLDELSEVATWVFGDGETPSIIEDSHDISKKLAPIVADEDALESLRIDGDIDTAMERLGGEEKYLQRRIAVASRALRDVVGLLPFHVDDSAVRSAVQRLLKLASSIERALEAGD